MHKMSQEMRSCIEACQRCYEACLGTAMTHCLEMGGKHVEPQHFRLMMACAEICQTSAHFMLLNSPEHKQVCGLCADICEQCAKDCERLGDMEECVTAAAVRRAAEEWRHKRYCRAEQALRTRGEAGPDLASPTFSPVTRMRRREAWQQFSRLELRN